MEFWTQMAQSFPQLYGVAGDLIVQDFDSPRASAIAERLKTLLPPQIQKQMAQGKPLPPEAQAALAQAEAMMQQVQEMGQQVQEAQAQAQTDINAASKAKADIQVASANIKVQEANLAKDVAEFRTLVAETQAKFAQESAQTTGDNAQNERQALYQAMSDQIGQALQQIQQDAGTLLQAYAEQMQQVPQMVAAVNEQQAASKPQRTGRTVNMQRGKNGLEGQITETYSDGSTQVRNARVQRGPNGFVGQMDEPQTVQ
jgi:hypothetical protein